MKLNKFVISTISNRAYICEHGPARQCDGAQGRSRCRQCNLLSFLSQSCMNVCDLVEHSPHREIHRLIILCNILQGGIFYQRSYLVVKKYWKQVSNKRERYLFTLFFVFIPGVALRKCNPTVFIFIIAFISQSGWKSCGSSFSYLVLSVIMQQFWFIEARKK
jgi:hypothetical protein